MACVSNSKTQTRSHSGHRHHHHHDSTYLTSANRKDAGVRITRIGLFVNIGMAIGKGVGGAVFHSQALVADAIHSLSDLVSDVMTLATVSWSLKPPSQRFPTGYGKIESLGSLGVSGLLLGGGFMMGWTALLALVQQLFPEFAELMAQFGVWGHTHGHSHGHTDLGPNINAAWLAGGSIVIKEWLYRATLKVAKERKSSVLASNAVHHRVDSLTAFVALLTIAGSNFLSNAQWLDPVGGLVISLMVIQAGWTNIKTALLELADVGVEEDMKINVRQAAQSVIQDLSKNRGACGIEIRQVQGLKSGQNYLMEIELAVPGDWSLDRMRTAEDIVRERIGAKVRGVKRVKVRFVATEAPEQDFTDEFIRSDVSPRSSPEPESEATHSQTNGSAEKRHAGNGKPRTSNGVQGRK